MLVIVINFWSISLMPRSIRGRSTARHESACRNAAERGGCSRPRAAGAVRGGSARRAVIYPGDPLAIGGPPLVQPFADAAHPLGTDRLGRDVAAGLAHGTRTSLIVAVAAAVARSASAPSSERSPAFSAASPMRSDAHHRSVPDVPAFCSRLLSSVTGPSVSTIVIAIAIGRGRSRAHRPAEVLSLRERDFVAAARVIGMRPMRSPSARSFRMP